MKHRTQKYCKNKISNQQFQNVTWVFQDLSISRGPVETLMFGVLFPKFTVSYS
jgi:hypothetical protein